MASANEPHVVIIGGGVGGIIHAIYLKRELGFSNITIFEQGSDLTGVWHFNTYPGAASDVRAHWYSLSTDLNPDWETSNIGHVQLKAYWKGLITKYALEKCVYLNTSVLSAQWNSDRQIYHIQVEDRVAGKSRIVTANAVISAIGSLDVPHYPAELKGIQEKFRGAHFHSARWDHSVDLKNKRVAVIGNGCSAIQLVPFLSEDPTTHVTSFCRTPSWLLPNMAAPISGFWRAIFRYIPFAMRLQRWAIFSQFTSYEQHETIYALLVRGPPSAFGRRLIMKILRKYIQATAPAEYHERLTPKYPFGCKRFIIDAGYLKALHRPNNDVNFDGVADVTEKGILTKKGEHYDLDVIVEATGFVVDDYPLEVRGVGGKTIQEYFREQAGPTAYRGTTVPGFPNFFMALVMKRRRATYVVQMLKPILTGLAASFEITRGATNSWNAQIQKRISGGVWTQCHSYYQVGQTGKNTAIWPGSMSEQWWELSAPVWGDYKAVGATKWENRRRLAAVWRAVEVGLVLSVAAWAYLRPENVSQLVRQVGVLIDWLILAGGLTVGWVKQAVGGA
ncbi:hypothetical protein EIP91_010226 [Steccherinum ochraceum]|uniref:L-ornithine N(5)-oxygenase n=1 Tax=Steccherinum ochraceum TaxID=92696 RepID=A0A4R0R0V0_9APHY|nr:hypothetical protein EIP91_010226 [Steccherinum ochraceum]